MLDKIAVLMSASTLIVSAWLISESPVLAKSQTSNTSTTKSKHRTTRIASGRGSYFVPPPPPYQPSILPEMASHRSYDATEEVAEAPKPANPYSKYIYVRDQADAPTVVLHPNSHVTVWHKTK